MECFKELNSCMFYEDGVDEGINYVVEFISIFRMFCDVMWERFI